MSEDSVPRTTSLWLALIVMGLSAALAYWTSLPPAPLGLDAPTSVFSAGRAEARLRYLLGDQRPHPIGSEANQAVRDRLVAQLAELGLAAKVQRAVGCNGEGPGCGLVENVVAEIPGVGSDAIAVMAHYDSVAPSPGAGDDGAGVAAILEVARVLLLQPKPQNSILLVFTDGEEPGLLGAEAFFSQHPLRSRIKAVINLEGSGSGGGPVVLLRTANEAGHLIDSVRRGARQPNATSLAQEIFERMPNDTDFSVAQRAGLPSIDFVFASERNHYHTPLDNIENLHKGSLQHHGEILLPLTLNLMDADLSQQKADYVYLTLGGHWIAWATGLSLPIALAGFIALAFAQLRLWRRTPLLTTAAGYGRGVIALLLSVLTCMALLMLADLWVGTRVDYPANPWPWRALLYAGAGLGVLFVMQLRGRGFWAAHLGVWLLLSSIAVTMAVIVPLGSNVLSIPCLLVGLLTLGVAAFRPAPGRWAQALLSLSSVAVLSAVIISLVPVMEETQGYQIAPAIYGLLAVGYLALLPMKRSRGALISTGVVTLGALLLVGLVPLYSDWRPQSVNIYYLQDSDSKTAKWLAYSPNPLPESIREVVDYRSVEQPRYPWSSNTSVSQQAAAPWTDTPVGDLQIERQGDQIQLTYLPAPMIDHVNFIVPKAAVAKLAFGDQVVHGMENVRADYARVRFYNPPSSGITLTLTTTQPEIPQMYLLEGRNALPASAAEQLSVRDTLAVPQHRGDQWLSFRRITTPESKGG